MEHRHIENRNHKRKKVKLKLIIIMVIDLCILIALALGYHIFASSQQKDVMARQDGVEENENRFKKPKDEKPGEKQNSETEAERKEREERERLVKEQTDRQKLIEEANQLLVGYYYDEAIERIKSYTGSEGSYEVYPVLLSAISEIEDKKSKLIAYGGSYTSSAQIHHIFFHSLIADNSKAFDGDYDTKGYNMYMTTVYEFKNMMQKMYEDNYVLVSIYDITEQKTLEDGSVRFVEKAVYLPEGKKPFILSQDDVNYYDYMDQDGFASRIVIGADGKPTCEMILKDGSVVQGEFDIVPILDAFIEQHPDFSYRGAKGILALTGYEGALGYRTDDPSSSTYEEDKETVKKVATALKEDGWLFASHTWGHKNMQTSSLQLIKTDMNRWLEEVGSLIGPTDLLIFPFGIDIETTMGHYSSDKFEYLKGKGFHYYMGVFKDPWMQVQKDYIRMTRRPLDGQAMLQFPERLADLFEVKEIIDPDRPERNW